MLLLFDRPVLNPIVDGSVRLQMVARARESKRHFAARVEA